MTALVSITGLSKRYGPVTAVDAVDLEIARGEFLALLGPSGSGKTSLLRLLAGFETPDQGRIVLEGQDVARTPPYDRPVNMVFQAYALFPHLSVAKNVAFGLEMEKRPKAEIESRVAEALKLVELDKLAGRRPDQLSGGQRQRVAIARAVVKRPKLLLLDEPLSALDRRLRERTRAELKDLQARLGLTFVMVTHDQDEAMAVASRIAVLNHGRIVQAGPPADVFDRPADRFVAEFLGDCNLLAAEVVAPDRVRLAGESIELNIDPLDRPPGAEVTIALRPGKILVGPDGRNMLNATVRSIEYLGDLSRVVVRIGEKTPLVLTQVNRAGPLPAVGDGLFLTLPPAGLVVLPS